MSLWHNLTVRTHNNLPLVLNIVQDDYDYDYEKWNNNEEVSKHMDFIRKKLTTSWKKWERAYSMSPVIL